MRSNEQRTKQSRIVITADLKSLSCINISNIGFELDHC
jgi:hypothetical protein